jgi:hypothetical protein
MKMHPTTRNAAILLLVCAGAAGCGAGAAPPPTETATAADTPTATHRGGVTEIYVKNPPTPTRRRTRTPVPTTPPANTCSYYRHGSWASEEHVLQSWMTTPWSMLYFKADNCEIFEMQIFAYPAKGKAFAGTFLDLHQPIDDREFSFTLANPDGPGSISVYGKFTTYAQCQGFIMFSEGFLVEGYVLPAPVTFGFTAGP